MKKITIVCVSYKRYKNIPILIHSFLAQTLQNFKLLVIHDGPDAEMDTLLRPYKEKHPDIFDYRFTDTRFNDYGHSLRDIGIKLADTEYILLTNDDNYYCPKFLEYMFLPIQNESPPPDIVFCDMIHSHNNPGDRQQLPYNFFETQPAKNSIDIGCFIVRTDLAEAVGFRDKGFAGDATYFEDVAQAAGEPKIIKIPMVLFVHN
jgi:glycosyltransferase involved in cell wall biosynthesis